MADFENGGVVATARASFSAFFVHLVNVLDSESSPPQPLGVKIVDFVRVPANVVWLVLLMAALLLTLKLLLRIVRALASLGSFVFVGGQVDWKSNRNGGELVAQVLVEHGKKKRNMRKV